MVIDISPFERFHTMERNCTATAEKRKPASPLRRKNTNAETCDANDVARARWTLLRQVWYLSSLFLIEYIHTYVPLCNSESEVFALTAKPAVQMKNI